MAWPAGIRATAGVLLAAERQSGIVPRDVVAPVRAPRRPVHPSNETVRLPEAPVKSTKLAPSPYGAPFDTRFVLAGTATFTG
jgi:hypothetical protein